MKKIFLCILSMYFITIVFSQKITKEEYIQAYKDFAIREMKRMGVPAAGVFGLLVTLCCCHAPCFARE